MNKLLLLLFILFSTLSAYSAATSFNLTDVIIECPPSESCERRKIRFLNLKGEYRSLVHLRDSLKIVASDGGYKSFSYDLFEDVGNYKLEIRFKLKPKISGINIGFTDRKLESDPSLLMSMKEGEFFENHRLDESLGLLQKRLESIGYPSNSYKYDLLEDENKNEVSISVTVTLGRPRIFKNIRTNSASLFINKHLTRKFFNLYNKPFDFSKFKSSLDEAQKELFSYGYYLVNLDFVPVVNKNRVTLDIKVTNEDQYAFDFKNNKIVGRDTLIAIMSDLFRKYKRPLNDATIKQALQEHYKMMAMLNTNIEVQISSHKNKFNETVHLYRIFINEHFKTRLLSVSFSGNSHYPTEKLHQYFKKESFELASIKYYDEEFFDYFAGYLRNRYLRNGFVQARVDGPIKTFTPQKNGVHVEYLINEGRRAFVREVTFAGLPPDLVEMVLASMVNRQGNPFNPIALVEDIKKVTSTLQDNGYYFAEVANANDDSLAVYSQTSGEIDLNFIVNAGQVIRLNRVLVLGNDKTLRKVIVKKIPLEEGDLITPSGTRDIEAALSATGLFNSVSITPIRHGSKNAATDLIVKVTEREYGLLELAPGYRTDLGIKLSGTTSYLNIGGRNQSITLRSQVNQRLNYQTFDPRRRKERKALLEHNTSLIYNISDIFDSLIDASAGISFQRKRFYSFDADISRFNTTLTRDLNKRLSVSSRYQLEQITQWDATELRDQGSFRIGAITPSLTYDLRNSQVNPVRGSFYNLSCEFANPFFLSQKNSDLTVNYYKFISRNRFYFPYKRGTLAVSAVGGIQENLEKEQNVVDGVTQTQGYIPNIKVFRLTGLDIVRGFNDEEINKLSDGRDISQVRVDDKAYIANFKIEPRYFINDTFMTGIFLDAGRVYVDKVDFGQLRTSAGVTFKILTPVGTLDFDYGIKLLRKKNLDGRLEDPGRFHVSIGFF